jgi:hypothetical protein
MAADQAEKVRENKLRRMADRRGYDLAKSRARDPQAPDYGRWTLIDRLGLDRYALLTLDEVEQRLSLPTFDDARRHVMRTVESARTYRRDAETDRLYELARDVIYNSHPDATIDDQVAEVIRRLDDV